MQLQQIAICLFSLIALSYRIFLLVGDSLRRFPFLGWGREILVNCLPLSPFAGP